MLISENQVFRITYEAFSKFSNSLIKSQSLEELASCFKINLKYLFHFYVFRASYRRGNFCIHLTVTPQAATIDVQEKMDYLPFENDLKEKGIPLLWSDLQTFDLPEEYRIASAEEPQLWGWCFNHGQEREIIVSLLSGKSQGFSKKNILFLTLVAENLESKLLELCLFRELDEKNAHISSIIEVQKEIIALRTQELSAKNAQLLEISVLNAHHLREPLSRILGLISVMEYYKSFDEIKRDVLPRLRKSSNDLDIALQDVIERATKDLIELKA